MNSSLFKFILIPGRAIAQAVSRRLPTAAVPVRARVRSCGLFGGQSDTGAGFLQVLQFPLPIRTLQLPASNNSSSQGLNRTSPLTNSLTHSLTHSLTNSLHSTALHCTSWTETEFESYITTDSQSVSLSWNKNPTEVYDKIFFYY
jgi:hypothetical protein